MLRFVTLTGAGEKTSISRMAALSKKYPLVEWGILYDENLAGTQPRYPSLEWIQTFVDKAASKQMSTFIHLCGSVAKRLLHPPSRGRSLADRELLDLLGLFGRVQLNLPLTSEDAQAVTDLQAILVRTEQRTRLVVQWNYETQPTFPRRMPYDIEAVLDASGGKGRVATAWPAQLPHDAPHRRGYAGGFAPSTLGVRLEELYALNPEKPFWVDAESSLFNSKNLFDLGACEDFLDTAYAARYRHVAKLCAKFGKGERSVQTLPSFWLEWWLCATLYGGNALVIPPKDAVRATTLYRPTGEYHHYNEPVVTRLTDEKIALMPLAKGRWAAHWIGDPSVQLTGLTLEEAGSRAIVAKYFGLKVPKDMMQHPKISAMFKAEGA